MPIRCLLLALLVVAMPGSLTAQDRRAPKRRKIPSWLPQPPQRAARPVPKADIQPSYTPKGFPNLLTANVPTLMVIGEQVIGGGGFEYARSLDAKGLYSVSLAGYGGYTFIYPKTDGPVTSLKAFYAVPGFHIHPQGNKKRIDYSAGIALALGNLHRRVDSNDYRPSSSRNAALTAMLAQLNMNVHHSKAFVFGLHFSIGPLLSSDEHPRLFVQGGLKFGARF